MVMLTEIILPPAAYSLVNLDVPFLSRVSLSVHNPLHLLTLTIL